MTHLQICLSICKLGPIMQSIASKNGFSSPSASTESTHSDASSPTGYLGTYLAVNLNGTSQQRSQQHSPLPNGSTSASGMQQKTGDNNHPSHSPSLSPKSLPSSNDTLNSFTSTGSSGLGNSLLPATITGSNASLADYLSQLIRDKKLLATFPSAFIHVDRLLEEEINKVRVNLFQTTPSPAEPLTLPEPESNAQPVTLTEKVYIPQEEFPDFNFVGRILGPRGLTAKQLEKETQCKIMIRGKGSMRDKTKEASMKGKPNWEHLNDKLHVLVTVEDTPERARIKMDRAVDEIKKLLVPISENDDELKKRQLLELAIINGTYRDSSPKPPQTVTANISQLYLDQANQMQARLHLLNSLQNMQRLSPAMGAPLVLPTQTHRPVSASSTGSSAYYPAGTPLTYTVPDAATAQLLATNPEYAAYYSAAFSPTAFIPNGEYVVDSMHGGVAKQKRHLGTNREHPYSGAALAAAMAAVVTNARTSGTGSAAPASTASNTST